MSNHVALSIPALGMLALAALFVALNWMCFAKDLKNKRKGIDRHVSTVPIPSLLFTILAYVSYPHSEKNWMLLVPLADIANWQLAFWICCQLVQKVRERERLQNKPLRSFQAAHR